MIKRSTNSLEYFGFLPSVCCHPLTGIMINDYIDHNDNVDHPNLGANVKVLYLLCVAALV